MQERDGRHPHGGAIPEAPVGFGHGTRNPFPEVPSVASVGVTPAPALKRYAGVNGHSR